VVLIPTDRSEEKDIPHVIREEMTQALGLPGDNTVLPESITYSRGFDHGNSSTLSSADKAALRLLYSHLEPLDNTEKTKQKFNSHWKIF